MDSLTLVYIVKRRHSCKIAEFYIQYGTFCAVFSFHPQGTLPLCGIVYLYLLETLLCQIGVKINWKFAGSVQSWNGGCFHTEIDDIKQFAIDVFDEVFEDDE